MTRGDYEIGNFYEPGYNSFKPDDGSPNYLGRPNLIPAGQMGMTLDPRTANQLAELSKGLNVGTKYIESGVMNMNIFDTIPKQHFEEIRRKAKLAGAKVSIHAPIQDMDPSGFGERGWDETKRELVEKQLQQVIDKAAIIDKEGNMPITIHGSNTAGSTFKMKDRKKQYEMLVGVDKVTGQLVPIKEQIQFSPGGDLEKGEIMDPMRALEAHNQTTWRKEVDSVLFEKENADRILSSVDPGTLNIYRQIKANPGKAAEIYQNIPAPMRETIAKLQTADAHIHQAELNVTNVFDKAYQYGGKDEKEREKIREHLKKIAEDYDKTINGGYTSKDFEKLMEKAREDKLKKDEEEKLMKIMAARADLRNQSSAIQNFAENLRHFNPGLVAPIEEFAVEKASETFANVALHSFKEHGEGAPVVSIENLYQGMGFSQGEDLRKLVEESQRKFVEKAVKDGVSKSKAEDMAKKLIGVTFDVGHLNISQSHGFDEKDLVKEAEAIKKHVKHVHITDNFGNVDSHLPIGMGNVPVQALLEAIGEEGAQARKINEVGGWFEHFKTNPFNELLGGVGAQVYTVGDGPTWNYTSGFQQSYLGGYGDMLPDIHYRTFGAGFSQLPQELGGNMGGGSGENRMGGGF